MVEEAVETVDDSKEPTSEAVTSEERAEDVSVETVISKEEPKEEEKVVIEEDEMVAPPKEKHSKIIPFGSNIIPIRWNQTSALAPEVASASPVSSSETLVKPFEAKEPVIEEEPIAEVEKELEEASSSISDAFTLAEPVEEDTEIAKEDTEPVVLSKLPVVDEFVAPPVAERVKKAETTTGKAVAERKPVAEKPVKKEKPKKEKKEPKKTAKVYAKYRNHKRLWYLVGLAAQVGCLAIFFTTIVRTTVVASGSMEPTLKVGDYVVCNKLAYVSSEVERGDVVSFWDEASGELFTKRVIGVAGDKIWFRDGYVFINGQILDESDYIAEDIETNCTKMFTVPEGCVFVLGDNRENSIDSRFFENPYISVECIEGKYFGTVPSLSKLFPN